MDALKLIDELVELARRNVTVTREHEATGKTLDRKFAKMPPPDCDLGELFSAGAAMTATQARQLLAKLLALRTSVALASAAAAEQPTASTKPILGYLTVAHVDGNWVPQWPAYGTEREAADMARMFRPEDNIEVWALTRAD